MRISIQTLGTLGDVMPFLAVGRALQQRGHEVSLLAPRDHAATIAAHGVSAACPPGFSVEDWMAESRRRGTLDGPFRFFRDWPVMIRPHVDDVLHRSLDAARHADLVLANPIAMPARIAAEHYRLPFLLMSLQPVLTPSRDLPCAMIARQPLGPILNRTSYLAISAALAGLAFSLGKARRRLVEPPRPGFGDLSRHLGRPLPRITALPAALAASRPADFDADSHLVDYPDLQSPTDALPAEIDGFLRDGPPPFHLGLGSMQVEDGPARMAVWLDRLESAGQRGIVSGSLAGTPPGRHGQHLVCGPVPHDHLFRRCAAVIHHGGAGTLDTAARAGCPQIILPQVLDQFWNANRLVATGAAASHTGTATDTGRIDVLIAHALSDGARQAARDLAARAPAPGRAREVIADLVERSAAAWPAAAR